VKASDKKANKKQDIGRDAPNDDDDEGLFALAQVI